MNGIVYETSQIGLEAVLKAWQLKALHVMWSTPEGAKSFIVWEKVNKMLKGETISRASIINFLEAMHKMGVLSGKQETGKGGYHWVYFPAMDEAGFKHFIAKTLLEKLMKEFPDEMREAIKTLN